MNRFVCFLALGSLVATVPVKDAASYEITMFHSSLVNQAIGTTKNATMDTDSTTVVEVHGIPQNIQHESKEVPIHRAFWSTRDVDNKVRSEEHPGHEATTNNKQASEEQRVEKFSPNGGNHLRKKTQQTSTEQPDTEPEQATSVEQKGDTKNPPAASEEQPDKNSPNPQQVSVEQVDKEVEDDPAVSGEQTQAASSLNKQTASEEQKNSDTKPNTQQVSEEETAGKTSPNNEQVSEERPEDATDAITKSEEKAEKDQENTNNPNSEERIDTRKMRKASASSVELDTQDPSQSVSAEDSPEETNDDDTSEAASSETNQEEPSISVTPEPELLNTNLPENP